MTNNNNIRVFLLLTTEGEVPFAKAVCDTLSSKYGIHDVAVRSAKVPMDRLASSVISDDNNPNQHPVLWVLLKTHATSTFSLATTGTDDDASPVPLLELELAKHSSVQETSLTIAKFCGLSSPETRLAVQKALFARRQARLVEDAQWHTQSPAYEKAIERCYDHDLQINGYDIQVFKDSRVHGKVRDRYEGKNTLALVTTDRQSGFDRQLAKVPFKGAVLNLTSAFWFDKTKYIIPNHLISVPHPNVSIVKKCKPFPIEFVVRSYMTGSTSTSIWKNYQDGVRNYCGHELPEGMKKNQKLDKNLLTPTTKEEDHDRPISAADIVKEGWMSQADFDVCEQAALRVFALGQQLASEHGLVLVDTKYEFGHDLETGEILLIDEVHTPDSSRYWLASTYEERIAEGKEPDNIDKEFLRLWFREHCDPYQDRVLPEAPKELVCELARRYVTLYEMITWKEFEFDFRGEKAIGEALTANLS